MLQDKATIVKVLGIEKARTWAQMHTMKAVEMLSQVDGTQDLRNIATDMLGRIN